VSGTSSASEQVDLTAPAPGTYTVYIHGFDTANGAPSTFKLYAWALGSTNAGNTTATVNPATGTIGGTGSVDLTFSGLAPATKYLGAVVYGGAAASAPPTTVRVDTP